MRAAFLAVLSATTIFTLAHAEPLQAQSASPPPAASPAAAAPADDAARLATARAVVLKIFPEGTYARIMNGSMAQMVEGMSGSVGDMQLRQIVGMSGASEGDIAKLGKGTLKEMMAVVDPAFEERTRRMSRVMFAEMGQIMSGFEPEVREGLSRAYAHHFTPAQLTELDTFFATPTGTAFARDSMVIFMEPEVMEVMQSVTPRLMKQMPGIMEKVRQATADLPPMRTAKDLTPEQRKRLEQLIGQTAGK